MAGMSRLQVLANGWLKEVHRGACKLAVVDRRFAAEADIHVTHPIGGCSGPTLGETVYQSRHPLNTLV
jgi:hypothetical protein